MEPHDKVIAAHSGVRRFVTAGNAGGVVATLSLIGVMVGASPDKPVVPLEIFGALVVFVLGLFLAGMALTAETGATLVSAQFHLSGDMNNADINKLNSGFVRNSNRGFWCSTASGVLLLIGVALGLWQIYALYVVAE
jgi:hypothetical protein